MVRCVLDLLTVTFFTYFQGTKIQKEFNLPPSFVAFYLV